jgi:two-component system NtrC family response regulator
LNKGERLRKKRILVVDDDESLRWVTQAQLQQSGYEVVAAADGTSALEQVPTLSPDLVITDLKMPGMSGLDLLKEIRTQYPEVIVIMVTAFGSVETAVDAMKAGAYDYITKPVNMDELRLVVSRGLEHLDLREEVRVLRSNLDKKYGFENILGQSKSLLHVLDMASRAAQATSTVLIHGETGTGKELLAKAIHFNSRRKDRPFVTINCGAIPKDLLESELFGHVKGSFTGALANKRGKVEAADGGTLFLDEIGELPLELQVKLLRLIQQGEVEKLGVTGATKIDVRIIAATHRNLQAMAQDGTFREDLYYRLAVIPLELPPVRERPYDIPELVQHFFVKAKEKQGRPNLVLPTRLLHNFSGYSWPGNVREMENIIERIVVLASREEITLNDLPDFLRRERPPVEAIHLDLPPHGISLEAVEKELIVRALEKFGGNQTQAAAYLDISRKTLIYRMEKFGLRKDTSASDEAAN